MVKMYPDYYKAFSQNISFAARALNYYLHISDLAKEKSNYNALNETARFWNDYNFMALQTVIIFLGKIFDSQRRTHNLTKLLDILPQSLRHFSRASLRARKIQLGGEFDGLNDYIDAAHELNTEDVKSIQAYAEKASALWDKIKPLRHRFYAHNQMLTDEERDALFKRVTYNELQELIQILLNIAHVLEQAEINGRKPDFSDNDIGTANQAKEETDRLLGLLVRGNS